MAPGPSRTALSLSRRRYAGGTRSDYPTNPTPVTSIPLGGNLVRLIPTERGLYGSLWDMGIVQIPLVEGLPQRPVMLTTLREVGEHLAVSEHGMFVGQWMAGVQIYQRSTVTDTVYLPLLQR